ncbi:MAG: DUF1345 domain-containing protein, partial [Betaproteobacteria bacterium]|nr:DUF1345 domain-containing protein [Betaproteobacteria bacterium]
MTRLSRLPRALRALLYRPRLSVATMLGVLLFVVLESALGVGRAMLLAFDIACCVYFGSIAWMMARTTPENLRRRAEQQMEGKWTILVLSTAVSAVVLLALRTELHASKGSSMLDLALPAATIVLAWLFFSVVFAQTYAHSDHLERLEGQPGLLFPGANSPDYWDYLYFSVVLSMTFQTSDVNIASRNLRHMVLLHSVAAFFFNVF